MKIKTSVLLMVQWLECIALELLLSDGFADTTNKIPRISALYHSKTWLEE